MSEQKRYSRLRRLALDYAEGHIGRVNYLKRRAQFLDALSRFRSGPEGSEDPTVRRPRPDIGPEPDTMPWEEEKTVPVRGALPLPGQEPRPTEPPAPATQETPAMAPPQQAAPPTPRMPLFAAAVGMLFLLGAAVSFIWFEDDSRQTPSPAPAVEPVAEPVPAGAEKAPQEAGGQAPRRESPLADTRPPAPVPYRTSDPSRAEGSGASGHRLPRQDAQNKSGEVDGGPDADAPPAAPPGPEAPQDALAVEEAAPDPGTPAERQSGDPGDQGLTYGGLLWETGSTPPGRERAPTPPAWVPPLGPSHPPAFGSDGDAEILGLEPGMR